MALPQRLHLNDGGYHGETIAIDEVLAQISQAACRTGWTEERLDLGRPDALIALSREVERPAKRFYLSTGVHGDEPAGPLTALKLLSENLLPADCSVVLFPCLNPAGFRSNARVNADGVDINRDYRHHRTPEVRAQLAWLRDKGRYDCAVCLHEDWESSGFYLYAVNPLGRSCVGEHVVSAVRTVFPIDEAVEIEGYPALDGVIRPPFEPEQRPEWPESIFLAQQHAEIGYTFETSSDFPLAARVDAQVKATCEMVQRIREQGGAAGIQSTL